MLLEEGEIVGRVVLKRLESVLNGRPLRDEIAAHLVADLLIDYVNFKGEGVSETERYNNEGWGLLQILEYMKGKETGKPAMDEFSAGAKFVLERRVKNSDPKKNEKQWLKGWENRTETYKVK